MRVALIRKTPSGNKTYSLFPLEKKALVITWGGKPEEQKLPGDVKSWWKKVTKNTRLATAREVLLLEKKIGRVFHYKKWPRGSK